MGQGNTEQELLGLISATAKGNKYICCFPNVSQWHVKQNFSKVFVLKVCYKTICEYLNLGILHCIDGVPLHLWTSVCVFALTFEIHPGSAPGLFLFKGSSPFQCHLMHAQ